MSTNFLDLVNFGTTLSPEALCPFAEPLPPDSAGVAGVVMARLSTEPTACLLEGEGGLRRGKAIKIKHNNSEGYQAVITCHYSQQKRHSTFESSKTRRTAHPPAPGRQTPSDLTKDLQNKIQLRSNKDPKANSNQNTRQKKSDSHLSQYAPEAHLRAAEAYSGNFRD